MDKVWESAQLHMKRACELASIEPEVTELMMNPMRTSVFQIPVRMDDGSAKVFTACRVCHNDALGQTKDGTRVRPDLNVEEIKALAMFMSIKHAINGIPAGGGKGGIKADPAKLSKWEYERLIRGFIRRMEPKGVWVDIPGADIGTSLQTQAWMLDEFEQIKGQHAPAAVNDKPALVGGSQGGDEATGRGIYYVTTETCRTKNIDPKTTSVVIQGFGQVGSHAASLLYADGFKIVGVSDIYGGIYNPNGLDIPELLEHLKSTGSVEGFKGSNQVTNEQLLELDCDILIPAAVQNVIHSENADNIEASIIVEAANGPVTPEADRALMEKGVIIIPDVLANSGSAIVCHFERIQGLTDDHWELETVRERLKGKILKAYGEVLATAEKMGISMRDAAWVNAVTKIGEAVKLRGWA
jgi:glutamate dehydrogenase